MLKRKQGTCSACSFCGREQDRHRRLIAGPGVAICNECVGLCTEILQGEGAALVGPMELRHMEEDLESLPSEALLEGLRRRSAGIQRAEDRLQEAVTILRQRGTTWAKFGEALGVSRQSAWERYSGRSREANRAR